MRCVLGVDGGGSKTTCAVADASGTVLRTAICGPSNYHAIGIDAAQEVVQEAMTAALRAAAADLEIAGLCLALAGVARPEDEHAWRSALEQMIAQDRVPARWLISAGDAVITHDAMAALVGGAGKREGIVVIAGTGAIAFGANARGEQRRASGWGYLLGDEGSGYWIGLQGLRAVCRADDGRGPQTALTHALLGARGLSRPQDLVRLLYGEWKPADVASLAPVVLGVAAGGDAVASGIVDDGVTELAGAARAVLDGLGLSDEEAEVVTAGGLWDDEAALVRERFTAALHAVAPRAVVIRPRGDPVAGAILLARGAA